MQWAHSWLLLLPVHAACLTPNTRKPNACLRLGRNNAHKSSSICYAAASTHATLPFHNNKAASSTLGSGAPVAHAFSIIKCLKLQLHTLAQQQVSTCSAHVCCCCRTPAAASCVRMLQAACNHGDPRTEDYDPADQPDFQVSWAHAGCRHESQPLLVATAGRKCIADSSSHSSISHEKQWVWPQQWP